MQNDIRPPERPIKRESVEEESPIKNLDEPIVIDEGELEAKPKKPKKTSPLSKLKAKWAGWSTKQRAIAAASALLILILVVGGVVVATRPKHIPRQPKIVIKDSKPVTVASPLTGLQVAPDMAKRPVTAIMIENSTDARPQSGLQDAGVVFEAIAEGGITRFMALFQEARPSYIGPVRSLRPYYIDWATPFDASIVHVGGSPDALAQIRSGGKDLDQFFNAGAYWRQPTRPPPHNVYTSFDNLDNLNESKGYTSSKFTPFLRKKDQPLKVPSAAKIDLAISGPLYNVHYDYDAKTNSYARSEGGAPHMDLLSPTDTVGVRLSPKVVVAMVVPLGQGVLDASGAYYSDYSPNSSGQVYIFQDGGVIQGTWSKSSRDSQIVFEDSAGAPIKLNAGQNWITMIQGGQLSHAP